MAFLAHIMASVSGQFSASNALGAPIYDFDLLGNVRFSEGTGADQAQKVFGGERTLASGVGEDLDLAGVLTDAFGGTIAAAAVKGIAIVADKTNTTDLTIGNSGVNAFVGPFGAAAHTLTIGPGDFFVVTRRSAAGMAVTAGTGDILRVANAAGAAAKYRIALIIE